MYQEIIKVRGYEIDSNGHVNQATYLLYAESVRWNHFAKMGITLTEMQKRGIGPVILSQNISYYKELLLGDEIRITSVPKGFEGKRGTIHQEFFKGEVKAAELTMTYTFINLKERRSCPPPPEVLELLKN